MAMASEVAGMPNGTYAPHQAYGGMDQNNYAYTNNIQASQQPSQQAPAQAPPTSSTPSNAQQPPQPDIPKDEVGWYFVEQYYTTLSRSPEKLYLFYNKRSQFVSGQETDKVPVCVGQRAINDKIKDLEFQDCKVRVTNVDSQASDSNIVIQVIGELSNKGQPHRKFTQTFVLATQTNGYFVLNDIFRYLVEEEDEPEAEAQQPAEEVQQTSGTESGSQEPAPTESEPKTLSSSSDPASIEISAKKADKEVEEKLTNNVHDAEGTVPPAVNGESAAEELPLVEEKSSAQPEPEAQPKPEQPVEETPAAAEADIEPEKLKDPEPTPVIPPAAPTQAPAQPAAQPKPAAPAAPKTWASLAASANKVATPAAPAATAPTATATRPAAKAVTPAPPAQQPSSTASSAPSAPAAQRQEAQGSDSQDEWTAVSNSHNRQQSRHANNVPQQEEPQNRGYIKNVPDNIEQGKFRAELEKFGELLYFDIARQKNCAFVDFKSPEAYAKALNTPFKVGDDELYVEKRHIRAGTTPYIPRGQFQGNRGGGRGGAGQGGARGNFQGGRGSGNSNGAPRGRGGYTPQRGGRGGAQA